MRRCFGLLLTFVLLFNLVAPTYLQASNHERLGRRLLTSFTRTIHSLLEKTCKFVSKKEGNSVQLYNFLCDEEHRVFAELKGVVVLKFPLLTDKWRQAAASTYDHLSSIGQKKVLSLLKQKLTLKSALFHFVPLS